MDYHTLTYWIQNADYGEKMTDSAQLAPLEGKEGRLTLHLQYSLRQSL
jgi:hypothetical protein